MYIKTRQDDTLYKKLVAKLKEGPRAVDIGILDNHASDTKTKGADNHDPNTRSLIEVAIAMEFGDPEAQHGQWQSPERSFLRAWVDENKKVIRDRLQQEVVTELADKGIEGLANFKWERVLERIGLWAQGEIQKRIAEGTAHVEPNHPLTIKRKGSDVPLIDTGQLRSAISYVLSKP